MNVLIDTFGLSCLAIIGSLICVCQLKLPKSQVLLFALPLGMATVQLPYLLLINLHVYMKPLIFLGLLTALTTFLVIPRLQLLLGIQVFLFLPAIILILVLIEEYMIKIQLLTNDSLTSISIARSLNSRSTLNFFDQTEVIKRGFSLPFVYSLNSRRFDVPSFTFILLILFIYALFLWGISLARNALSLKYILTIGLLAAALLFTTPIGFKNIFYANSHLLVALELMLLFICRVQITNGVKIHSNLLIISSLLANLAVTRPEGYLIGLVILLDIIHLLINENKSKYWIVFLPFTSIAAYAFWLLSNRVSHSAIAKLVIFDFILALSTSLLLRETRVLNKLNKIITFLPLTYFAFFLITSILDWKNFNNGLGFNSCISNVIRTGGWGNYWNNIIKILAIGVLLRRFQTSIESILILSIINIELLSITLKMFDGGGVCRIGWGDSVNRTLFHITGLLTMYIMAIVIDPQGDRPSGSKIISKLKYF
jgi:hypothetical protein